jgi:hypothetical protein
LFVAAGFSLRQKMTECGCLSSPLQAAGHSGIFCERRKAEAFRYNIKMYCEASASLEAPLKGRHYIAKKCHDS